MQKFFKAPNITCKFKFTYQGKVCKLNLNYISMNKKFKCKCYKCCLLHDKYYKNYLANKTKYGKIYHGKTQQKIPS